MNLTSLELGRRVRFKNNYVRMRSEKLLKQRPHQKSDVLLTDGLIEETENMIREK